jgi:TniQ
MNKPAHPLYEQWQLTLPLTPAPSVLYALVPVGVGTPLVESMTSYITRLAGAHCVFPGVLLRKVIAPFAENSRGDERGAAAMHIRDGKSTGAFNSTRQTASNAVRVLESLTRRGGLCALTMLTWAKVFPLFGLIRPMRAWCPCCLEEWRLADHMLYEPLLWAIQAVKVCPQHDRLLETHCPMCSKTAPWLAWRSRSGYCPHCQGWLGSSETKQKEHEREGAWLHWCADQVGSLLALASTTTNAPSRSRIEEGLPAILEQMSQGRKMTFARLVGLSPKMVGDWFYHQQLPSVENLLRVCFAVNLSLQDLLLEKQFVCSLRSKETLPLWESRHRRASRGFWKSEQIRQKLETIASSAQIPPPSLKAVARQLGGDPHSLKTYHPGPSQAISDRYAAYMSAKKLATEHQLCAEVQEAVRQLIEQNIPPTGRNVALVLSKPGILRSSVVREARRTAIRERQNTGNQSKEFPEKAKSVV